MDRCAGTFRDRMSPIGIRHKVEGFSQIDESIHEQLRPLVVHQNRILLRRSETVRLDHVAVHAHALSRVYLEVLHWRIEDVFHLRFHLFARPESTKDAVVGKRNEFANSGIIKTGERMKGVLAVGRSRVVAGQEDSLHQSTEAARCSVRVDRHRSSSTSHFRL